MKAIIITGKFATDREALYPLYRMLEEGWQVDIATRGKETVLGAVGEKIVPTRDIPVGVGDGYHLLILPGGAKAMEYMRQDQGILDQIASHHANRGVIGSICHAGQLLISAGLCRGRKISGYYSIKDDIKNAGGHYYDCEDEPHWVEQDRIVSTSHYKWMGPWMREVVRLTNERFPGQ